LVHHDGAVFTSVPSKIPLPVAFQIQVTGYNPSGHRLLPNGGMYGLTFPSDVTWEPDIH
jgi:hypothetical protein